MAARKHAPMDERMLAAVATQFRALSEPARLKLLQELRRGETSVNDLSAAVGFSQANTSKHLSLLHAAGFLRRRKQGTTVLYAVSDPVVDQLCAMMCARVSDAADAMRDSQRKAAAAFEARSAPAGSAARR